MRSHLSKNLEQKTKRNFVLTVIGIIVILLLLIQYGIPALINFSLFLGSVKNQPATSSQQKQNQVYITPPTLTQSFSATNSATVKISGTSQPHLTIKLFVNDTFIDNTNTKDDGSFTFDSVTLTAGLNVIKAKAQKDTSESDFSDPITIAYASKAPSLTIDSPSDGQTFDSDHNPVTIAGKTDADVKVTVNDFWAIMDSNGGYHYTLTLQGGDNQIKVIATDIAGNQTEKDIKLTLHYWAFNIH